jgi:hypothetical protein
MPPAAPLPRGVDTSTPLGRGLDLRKQAKPAASDGVENRTGWAPLAS